MQPSGRPDRRIQDFNGWVRELRAVLWLCGVQLLLMGCVALVFLSSDVLSLRLFEAAGVLLGYAPRLARYHQVVAHHKGELSEFARIFSIYLLNVLIQLIVLGWIIYRLLGNIQLRAAIAQTRWQKIAFYVLIVICLVPTVDLILGRYLVPDAALYSNRIVEGYGASLFIYCLLVPIVNFLLYFVILMTHGNFWQKVDFSELFRRNNTDPP